MGRGGLGPVGKAVGKRGASTGTGDHPEDGCGAWPPPTSKVALGAASYPGKAREPPQREWRPGLRAMPRQERIKRGRRFAKKGSPLPPEEPGGPGLYLIKRKVRIRTFLF